MNFSPSSRSCWDAFKGTNCLPSAENWRFDKRTSFREENLSPETLLERTISRVVDENWANQVPVDSGLVAGSAHWIDLVFRAGTAFSLIELKDESNTPLSAAIQVVRYGLVHAFTRCEVEIADFTQSSFHGSPSVFGGPTNFRIAESTNCSSRKL